MCAVGGDESHRLFRESSLNLIKDPYDKTNVTGAPSTSQFIQRSLRLKGSSDWKQSVGLCPTRLVLNRKL